MSSDDNHVKTTLGATEGATVGATEGATVGATVDGAAGNAVSSGNQVSGEGARPRIHLRDITAETPLDSDAVGAALRAARLKTGEDLKSVSDKLRIRRVYLEALEESRHEELPARAYAIGFVRTYAGYLGLDVAEMVGRYKLETAPEGGVPGAGRADGFAFPEVKQEARLPRGSLFILAVLLGAGVYGAWLLSISADRMVTERAQPQRNVAGAVADVANPNALQPAAARGLAGDSASAAPTNGALPVVNQPVRPAPPVATAPVAATPETEAATVIVGDAGTPTATAVPVAEEIEVAALTPVTPPVAAQPVIDNSATDTNAADVATEAGVDATPIATDLSLVMGGARVYGLENEGARVVVRATKSAWLRIEAGDGTVLLNETLGAGEMYRAPVSNGAILVARDAGAFELFVDGRDIGVAGPSGLVLTGKSLNPDDLLRR
ncbi:MAG: DUF4115 domain-containing protein [Parvibaculum sp.]